MNCPKCIGVLQEDFIEKHQVEVCYVCKGIWFDKEELQQILKEDAQDTEFGTEIGVPDFSPPAELKDLLSGLNEKVGKCPVCVGVLMDKKRFAHNVAVDVCPKCSGVWLDGGEVFRLRDRQWADFVIHFKFFKDVVKEVIKEQFNKDVKKP